MWGAGPGAPSVAAGGCKERSQGARRKRAPRRWQNRSGRCLRAWLRFSDAGPGPQPARLGGAELAPGSQREEAADLGHRRHRRSVMIAAARPGTGWRDKTINRGTGSKQWDADVRTGRAALSRGHRTACPAPRNTWASRGRPEAKQCGNPTLLNLQRAKARLWGAPGEMGQGLP